jgi:hypothetical protein
MLSWNEIRARCAAFAEHWSDASDEDADAKSFWDHLFTCYGANRRQVASFEAPVRMLNGNIGFIDLIWKGKLLVEHKSRGKDLNEARSQGLDYIERLKPHERPRWLVTSDFARFHIHDLHNGHEDSLLLTDLAAHAELFGFLAGYEPKRPTSEAPVNLEAVARLGGLYDAMKAGGYPEDDLPMFLVRVLFCLFAEDTGVFGRDVFTDFITYRTQEDGSDLGPRLEQFFRVLDTPKDRRQRHTDELLTGLEYVNGALFTGHLAFAEMNSAMRTALLACTEFDWSRISPAIFGSLFQGVMDAAERRAIGAHYTAEDNILKVIGPLFLDALKAELAAILTGPERGREAKLEAFHNKLAALNFFDPACGCGNFLIITYREIRKLEIQVLKALHPHGQLVTDVSLLSQSARLAVPRHRDRGVPRANRPRGDVADGPHRKRGTRLRLRPLPHPPAAGGKRQYRLRQRAANRLAGCHRTGKVLVHPGESAVCGETIHVRRAERGFAAGVEKRAGHRHD